MGGLDARVDAYYSWIEQQSQGDLWQADAILPQVLITSPLAGAVLGPSFTVEVSATDDSGVVSTALLLNGVQQGELAAPPFSFLVQNLAPGSYQLRAVATDGAGNQASAEIVVTVSSGVGGNVPSTGDTNPAKSDDGQSGGQGLTPNSGNLLLGSCAVAAPGGAASTPWPLALLLLVLVGISWKGHRG